MLLDFNLVAAGAEGRGVLAVLPTGYGPRKKRIEFFTVREDFLKALHCFTREFQGSVNIPFNIGMKTRLFRTINRKKP